MFTNNKHNNSILISKGNKGNAPFHRCARVHPARTRPGDSSVAPPRFLLPRPAIYKPRGHSMYYTLINVSYKINTVQLTLYSMSPIVLLWYTYLHNHFLCYRSLTLTQRYCLQTFAPWPCNDEVKVKTIIVRQICTFQALVSKLRINKLIQYFFYVLLISKIHMFKIQILI